MEKYGVMAKPTPLSGFPEWLPAQRIVEQQILSIIQETFELHGFAGIETRAVEPMDQLLRKGETSKEVYVLNRLQANESEEKANDKQLGLHFDLTVPFARYVLENAGHLSFPFKRYQIQKVWRGERPQDGRFREFYQADIDVVGAGELPYHFEVELPLVMAEAFDKLKALGVPEFKILTNNRRVSEGFYLGLGLEDVEGVLRNIDKLDKIGADKVRQLLIDEVGASQEQAQLCLDLAGISGTDASVVERVRELANANGIAHETLDQGLTELGALLTAASVRAPGKIEANLKIARGLDYYTGSVYESVLIGHEDLGSICSGGRYDTLASDGKNTYPGVGLSIGVSRLVSRLISKNIVTASRSVPTAVLVAVTDEEQRPASDAVAAALRARGIPTDVAPAAAKFGKQIKFADRRGIPFVWFPQSTNFAGEEVPHQVKDIRSGEQIDADPTTWVPADSSDLKPTVAAGE